MRIQKSAAPPVGKTAVAQISGRLLPSLLYKPAANMFLRIGLCCCHAAGGSKAKKHRAKHSPQTAVAELPRTVLHDSGSVDRRAGTQN